MKKMMVMVQLEQLQGTHGETRKNEPPPNHIRGIWWGTRMYSPMCCSKSYRQGVENTYAQREIEFLSFVATNEVGEQTWRWSRQSKNGNNLWSENMVVYCVMMEANLGIMSCPHDMYPSQLFLSWRTWIYQILCVITLPHFGHVGCKMSTCDDMSTK